MIFLVYVDDILVIGNSPTLIQHFIDALHSQFTLKDMGDLSFFLGVQISLIGNILHLSQQHYICDFLSFANMESCKSLPSPIVAGAPLSIHNGVLLENPSKYRSFVGALQYCTLTYPHIAYSVNKLCQF